MASDLVMNCLPMFHKKDTRQEWVNCTTAGHASDYDGPDLKLLLVGCLSLTGNIVAKSFGWIHVGYMYMLFSLLQRC